MTILSVPCPFQMRQKDQASRQDRYMLLTFEESPANIKAGWKENHMTFLSELKNLQATGLTSTGGALKNAFDLLNMNRMQTGIDTYGQGRCPFYLEPSMIVVLTDGNKITSQSGVLDQLNLPMHSLVPGSELTKEPFRWDQRIFSLVLRMAGTLPPAGNPEAVPPPDLGNPLNDMCEVTGGRSYAINSQRQLLVAIENLVQSVQPGVVINFEKYGPDPPPPIGQTTDNDENVLRNGVTNRPSPTPFGSLSNSSQSSTGSGSSQSPPSQPPAEIRGWQNCRKLIYVQRSVVKGYSVGHWPLPESFWPDHNSPALPPRTAHPLVRFMCSDAEPMVIESLPFDKYELEPSPLTQFILARKQPTVAWQVFVANSHKNSDLGHPFGYLKASTTLTCVNLFVMPYNYPVLLPLLDDLFKQHRLKPPPEWRDKFQEYLHNMPVYYAGPLKRALQRMGAPNLVPEHLEGQCLNSAVVTQLKKLKNQAKAEFEKLCSLVGGGKRPSAESMRVTPGVQRPSGEVPKLTELKLTYSPALKDRFLSIRSELNDFGGFQIAVQKSTVRKGTPQGDMFRNPFDIPRSQLLNQIWRMRANLLHLGTIRLQDDEALHSLPIGQMGNYQEHLKRQTPPLREIESTPVRQHMFGNPFKIDKRMMVDEADAPDPQVGLANSTSGSGPGAGPSRKRPADSQTTQGRPKRPKGPLPKDLILRPRSPSVGSCGTGSPVASPPVSPVPSSLAPGSAFLAGPLPGGIIVASSRLQVPSPNPGLPGAPTGLISIPGTNGDVRLPPSNNNNIVKSDSVAVDTNGCSLATAMAPASVTSSPSAVPVPVVVSQHPLMQLVHTPHPQAPTLGAGVGTPHGALLAGAAPPGAVGAPGTLPVGGEHNLASVPPSNGNAALPPQQPFARNKSKSGKLLNGFSDDRKEIVLLSREECDRITKGAIKCIRRPGKDFSELFALLADVKGQPTFPAIVERLVIEANRFKRKTLADQLSQQLPQMTGLGLAPNPSHVNIISNNNGCLVWRLAAAQAVVKR
ncbi:integrator complex subunit 6-A-like [Tropilaelaps mercedesae]|uniref:Integrator complex subunit 6-A-like n=1 Tax=Tropilaelaps mercedesae TaxID=418985 RepID=A0A1V9X2B6_9ACAR|nr:integrator complex subunit 6-A-like [Tropilaelaps mercedesae]